MECGFCQGLFEANELYPKPFNACTAHLYAHCKVHTVLAYKMLRAFLSGAGMTPVKVHNKYNSTGDPLSKAMEDPQVFQEATRNLQRLANIWKLKCFERLCQVLVGLGIMTLSKEFPYSLPPLTNLQLLSGVAGLSCSSRQVLIMAGCFRKWPCRCKPQRLAGNQTWLLLCFSSLSLSLYLFGIFLL